VNTGDLIAVGSGDSTLIGNVLSIEDQPDTGMRELAILGNTGDVRVVPVAASDTVHQVSLDDQELVKRLPDFEHEQTLSLGSVAGFSMMHLPEGMPVQVVTGDYGDSGGPRQRLVTGEITLTPKGAAVRTPDGRLLHAEDLIRMNGSSYTQPRLETIFADSDLAKGTDNYIGRAKMTVVSPGDRVQAYATIEKADGSLSGRWLGGIDLPLRERGTAGLRARAPSFRWPGGRADQQRRNIRQDRRASPQGWSNQGYGGGGRGGPGRDPGLGVQEPCSLLRQLRPERGRQPGWSSGRCCTARREPGGEAA